MSVAGFMIASAVVKGVGLVSGRRASKAAASEQQRLDMENIRLERLETEESIRRTELSHGVIEGQQKAQVGASGFAVGSSLDKYMEATQAQHASDIDWMRTSGASREAISEREASARYSSSQAAIKAGTISGIGDIIGTGATAGAAYNKWGWG